MDDSRHILITHNVTIDVWVCDIEESLNIKWADVGMKSVERTKLILHMKNGGVLEYDFSEALDRLILSQSVRKRPLSVQFNN